MCGGGGGKAAKHARTEELARKREIAAATSAIDRAFSRRGSQLDDFVSALREQFGAEAGRQKTIADRQLKFSLARGGLTGGSAAADTGTELGEEFQRGILKGERLSQSALADLKSADEASRARLVALAQGGAGVTSSATNAANALSANIKGARSSSGIESLGDIFGDVRSLFVQQQEAAERRRGLRESEIFAAPFSRAG
ncbi:MAG: hypothetical protein V3V10_05220 [Planctomycetota bacterium]